MIRSKIANDIFSNQIVCFYKPFGFDNDDQPIPPDDPGSQNINSALKSWGSVRTRKTKNIYNAFVPSKTLTWAEETPTALYPLGMVWGYKYPIIATIQYGTRYETVITSYICRNHWGDLVRVSPNPYISIVEPD